MTNEEAKPQLPQNWDMPRWPEDEPVVERKPYVEKSLHRFAVALALTPHLLIVQHLLGLRGVLAVDMVLGGVSIALAFLDARELRRVGYQVHGWWGILWGIVHLIHRTRRTGEMTYLPWIWVLSAIAAYWAGLALPADDADSGDYGAPAVSAQVLTST